MAPISRRSFIQWVGGAAGFRASLIALESLGMLIPASPQTLLPFALPPNRGKASVVILGGGIAGLVAAYELMKAGYRCTVLEARSRPGGRNWTVRKNSVVEFTDGSRQRCDWGPEGYLNAGPARLPSAHRTMLGYCRELGVTLEVEVNTSRSVLLEEDRAFGGKPVEQRQVINDTRGYVSELLAKALQRHSLDKELTREDQQRMLEFLKTYGDLGSDYGYRGSERSGFAEMPGAGNRRGRKREPLSLHSLLETDFWEAILDEEEFDMQATMLQPVGGMDRIPYAFAEKLGERIRYDSPVISIQTTAEQTEVVYRTESHGPQTIQADYCICALPLTMLATIPNNFSAPLKQAIASVRYDSAYKIAWESKRFWEEENAIYGGIGFCGSGPVEVVWYPSAHLGSERGVLLSGYSVENGTAFGKLPSVAAKLDASRAAVERLHPGRGSELSQPIYVNWGKIPYNLGSWVSESPTYVGGRAQDYYQGPYQHLLEPEGRVFFAGDHCSYLTGWQEGAALSAQRALQMIAERMQSSGGARS